MAIALDDLLLDLEFTSDIFIVGGIAMGLFNKFRKKGPFEMANKGFLWNTVNTPSSVSASAFVPQANEEDIMQSLLAGPYCINCGIWITSEEKNVCPQCGQDQRGSVQKEITNPKDMAYRVVSYCAMDEHHVISLFSESGYGLDAEAKKLMPAIFTLFNLGVASLWYLARYEQHPNRDEITKGFQQVTHDYLLHTWGAAKLGTAIDYLTSVIEEAEAILPGGDVKDRDVLTKIAKALQRRAESVIMGVPVPGAKFTVPSIHAFLLYFAHVCSFLPPLTAMLRKWDVE